MQVVMPFQTRGAVQQFAKLLHVRQLPGVVSQVTHGEVHSVQIPALKAYLGEQQFSPARAQVIQSPVPVHVAQSEGHSMQVLLPSQTRGAVQQLEVLLSHVRQVVGAVSQVAHGEVHGIQVVGAA